MARAEKKIHYLYKTTCFITGRWYIGMHSTHNLEDGYMGSGKRLRYSIRKYGVDNHKKEILEFFESRELLIEAEIKAITEDMVTDKNCMNLKLGGQGGFINEEHKQKFINSDGPKNFAKRLIEDEEFRLKHFAIISERMKKTHANGKIKYDTFKGKQHSDETKQKMSESSKGKGIGESNSQYGTCWITKESVNKKIKKEDLDTYLIEGWVKGRR
jgi:hypothetical protein